MLFLSTAAFSSALAVALAASSTHVLHEKRHAVPHGWQYHSRAHKRELLPVRIGLTQSNLDNAHDKLMEVADPDSANYGQHWDDNAIADFFAPSKDTLYAVKSWLEGSGIAADRVKQSVNRGWLDFQATTDEMEALLKTKYNVYKHNSGAHHLACDSYNVPEDVAPHVDFITPTIHFDRKIRNTESKMRRRRSVSKELEAKIAKRDELVGGWTGPKLGDKPLPNGKTQATLSDLCGEYSTCKANYGYQQC